MFTFFCHLFATKGPIHAVERLFEILYRFNRNGRRFDRRLDLIEKTLAPRNFKMTFFVTAATVQRHRNRIERLKALGHDIGSHGTFHTRMDLLNCESQLKKLRENYRILADSGHSPRGFRIPYLNYNSDTRKALELSPYKWTSGEVILWDDGLQSTSAVYRLEKLCGYHRSTEQLSVPQI